MHRLLLLPLLLLGLTASAQTAPAASRPGLNRPVSQVGFPASKPAAPTPLYIVDGYLLEAARLNDIRPEQIELVRVVKGEDAVARYGEKGRGGVILITTKAPAVGR